MSSKIRVGADVFVASNATCVPKVPTVKNGAGYCSTHPNFHAAAHAQAKLSPDGLLLATVEGKQLTVRHASGPSLMEVVASHTCLEAVDQLHWSPDSSLVLVGVPKRSSVQVFSPTQPDFRCKISEGVAGLAHAAWAPDSRHVVTTADFNLHCTFWSLVDQSTFVVHGPKDPAACVSWSPDGALVAVALRKDSKDSVAVFEAGGSSERPWAQAAAFPTATLDLASVTWSPDGGALVCADTCLRYLVLVYSPAGALLARLCAYENALGVKALSFSPSGGLLAVGSYDQSVRLVNPLNWRFAGAEWAHAHPRLLPTAARCGGLELWVEDAGGGSFSRCAAEDFAVAAVAPDESKPAPRIGVGLLAWSPDGRYLATRNDNMPTTLWVWDSASTGLLAAVSTLQPLRSARWSPAEQLLAFATASSSAYFWSPGVGARAAPAALPPSGLEWGADGASLLVLGQGSCSVLPRGAAEGDV